MHPTKNANVMSLQAKAGNACPPPGVGADSLKVKSPALAVAASRYPLITWGHSRSAAVLPLTNVTKPAKVRSSSSEALIAHSDSTESFLPAVVAALPAGRIRKGPMPPVWLIPT